MRSPVQHSDLFRPALLVVVMTFCSWGSVIHAQESLCGGGKISKVTNAGSDFLLAFMANEASDYDPAPSATDSQLVYIASTGGIADVTVTCPALGYSNTVHLRPYEGTVVHLNQSPHNSFIIPTTGIPDKTIVHVTSTTDIVCYGTNHKAVSADAFLALPRQVAGTEYIVMAYANSTNEYFGSALHPSEFCVASFDDANAVTISLPNKQALSYTLNAGEGVQIQANVADSTTDLTGSLVHSTKPVAVFGGHRRSEVPNGYIFPDSGGARHSSRDHLAEQIPPLSTWGKGFVFTDFDPDTVGEVVRVLAGANGDQVVFNGSAIGGPLAAGQFVDIQLPGDPALANPAYYITTTQPSLVGEFCHTASSVWALGDPFFAVVPPVDQTYFDYEYFISDLSEYRNTNYLVVTTEQSGIGSVLIDNVPIPSGLFHSVADQIVKKSGSYKYALATVAQPLAGAHRITSLKDNDHGITILAYGMGKQDSYGYSAGGLFKPLQGLWHPTDPVGMPYPGKPERPAFTIRNILGEERIWLDSIRIRYSSNPENIAVEASNVPMNGFGTLDPGADIRIELAPRMNPNQEIVGTANLYYHSGLWFDMAPLAVDFTVEPGTAASVGQIETGLGTVAVRPNPVRGVGVVDISLQNESNVSARLYDALGRVVRIVFEGRMGAGTNEIALSTGGLSEGVYLLEARSPGGAVLGRERLVVVR